MYLGPLRHSAVDANRLDSARGSGGSKKEKKRWPLSYLYKTLRYLRALAHSTVDANRLDLALGSKLVMKIL